MLPVAAQARSIRSLALRYAASAWPRERNCEMLPAASEGTFREWLWIAFKSGAPMPLGERQLRHVLGVCTKPLKAGAEATSSRSTPGMIGADPRAVIGATRAAQTERRRSRSPRRTRLAAAVLCCLATAACASQEQSASARERWCGGGGGAARGALVTVAAGAVGGAYAAGAGGILGAALGVALSPVGAVIGAVDGSKNNPCPDTKSTAAQPPSEVRPESSLDGDRRDRQSE